MLFKKNSGLLNAQRENLKLIKLSVAPENPSEITKIAISITSIMLSNVYSNLLSVKKSSIRLRVLDKFMVSIFDVELSCVFIRLLTRQLY